MSEIVHGAIDTDVHVEPPSIDSLKPYLSGYWLEYIRGARSSLVALRLPPWSLSDERRSRGAGGRHVPAACGLRDVKDAATGSVYTACGDLELGLRVHCGMEPLL